MHRRRGSISAACAGLAALLALPALAQARTQIVWAGGPPDFQTQLGRVYSAEANDFFPRTATIHAGDSIEWKGMSINFHSIDLPGRSGADLPLITPTGTLVSGVKDAAGNPFWFNGLPNVGFNPQLLAPLDASTYDGTERVDSGLPFGPPSDFRVTFTKPGVYEYFCDVHYDMRGFIVVKGADDRVPSAEFYAKRVAKQTAEDVKIAQSLVSKASSNPNEVNLGEAGSDNVEILAMFPSTLHVHTGATVTFEMSPLTGETHTATFGPDDYIPNAFLNPILDPRGVYPSSPTLPIDLEPHSHGNGFANTGALDRDPTTPLPPDSKITFSKPGVYHYECLIHPFMRGTVIVS